MIYTQAMAGREVFNSNMYNCLLWASEKAETGNYRKVVVTQQRPYEDKKIVWSWTRQA